MGARSNKSLICLLFLLFFVTSAHSEEKIPVKIKADSLKYQEQNRLIVASGNVEAVYRDVTMKANQMRFDLAQNLVTGVGDVAIKNKGQTIEGQQFQYDIQSQSLRMSAFHTQMLDEKTQESIYLTANQIGVTDNVYQGSQALFTTCDFDNPHWFVSAKEFYYYPNDRVEAFHVFMHLVFLPLPIAYFPYYQFQLGPRRVVLKMPLLGANPVEGGFVKTETVYFVDEHSQGSVYVDRSEIKGWGLGLRHQYEFWNEPGEFYFYGINERDTGIQDKVFSIRQKFRLSEDVYFEPRYGIQQIYLIPAGRANYQKDGFSFTHQNDFRSFSAARDVQNDLNTAYRMEQVGVTHRQDTLDTALNMQNQSNPNQNFFESNRTNLKHNQNLTSTVFLETNFDYSQQSTFKKPSEQQLFSGTRLIHRDAENKWYQSLTVDNYWYTNFSDPKLVTSNAKIQYVEKLPEVSVQLYPASFKTPYGTTLNLTQTYQAGRYRESKDVGSLVSNRIFTATRYSAEYKLDNAVPLPLGSTFNIQESYVQHAYETQDQNYLLLHRPRVTSLWWGFIRNEVSYTRDEFQGGSAFFFDSVAADQERVNETLTFFSPGVYEWRSTAGKNLRLNLNDDTMTYLKLSPWGPQYTIDLQTGVQYDLSNQFQRYRDFVGGVWINPDPNLSFKIDFAKDLNNGDLKSAGSIVDWRVGTKEFAKNEWNPLTSQWRFLLNHRYDFLTKQYKLNHITVEKDLHDWTARYVYDDLLQQHMMMITLKIAPDFPVGASYGKYGVGIKAFENQLQSPGVNRNE